MKIFVTVGTTPYDELFTALNNLLRPEWQFDCQTVNSLTLSPSLNCFEFTDEWGQYVEQADLVVCHAGAGSVYALLEMAKKIIVVPNLTRSDKHQSDLAKYLEDNNYCLVCRDLTSLESIILLAKDFVPNKYQKVSFFKGKEISEHLIKSIL